MFCARYKALLTETTVKAAENSEQYKRSRGLHLVSHMTQLAGHKPIPNGVGNVPFSFRDTIGTGKVHSTLSHLRWVLAWKPGAETTAPRVNTARSSVPRMPLRFEAKN